MEEIQIKKYSVDFTQVSNILLEDNNISLRAKGMYAYLFSKPDGWQFHLNIMQKELQESKGQIRTIINELIEAGYIIRTQFNENGKFGGTIIEFVNIKNRIADRPCSEKTEYGQTLTHNNIYNNNNINNINNTDIKNIKNKNINIFIKKTELSDEEIINGWNEIAKKYQLPTITILSNQRKSKLKTILKKFKLTLAEYYDILDDRIKKSLFLQGVKQIKDGNGGFIFDHSADWHSDFDFFLRESSFVKTLDNKYTDAIFLKK